MWGGTLVWGQDLGQLGAGTLVIRRLQQAAACAFFFTTPHSPEIKLGQICLPHPPAFSFKGHTPFQGPLEFPGWIFMSFTGFLWAWRSGRGWAVAQTSWADSILSPAMGISFNPPGGPVRASQT